MRKFNLNVSRIESMGLTDGPGVRYLVFLQGCPLKCIYCHNPEMLDPKKKNQSYDEELNNITAYKEYFGKDGGVTISGGEPLLQSKQLIPFLKFLKSNKINICLDTSGVGPKIYFNKVINYIDTVIFDIKGFGDVYQEITKTEENGFEFLDKCVKKEKRIIIKYVLVKGITDTNEQILKLIEFLKLNQFKEFSLIPFHNMAKQKYEKLGKEYQLAEMNSYSLSEARQIESYIKTELGIV